MIDPLLLPLGRAAFACYDETIKPTWSARSHVYLTGATNIPGVLDGTPIFSYEGTASDKDWLINFCALPWAEMQHPEVGLIHLGWHESVVSTFQYLVDYLSARNWPPFMVSGHSKGAAEAGLATLEFTLMGHPPLATRLYEPPKFGSILVTRKLAPYDVRWTQTTNDWGPDKITLVPDGLIWDHLINRVELIVPNHLDIAEKHKMPAVLESISKLAIIP